MPSASPVLSIYTLPCQSILATVMIKLLTVIAPVARRDSLVGWQQLFLQTLTVSVKASVLMFPAVASEEEALPPSDCTVTPDGVETRSLTPWAVVLVWEAVTDTFTRYVPGSEITISLPSSLIPHPHTLEVARGMIAPDANVWLFML